MNFANLGDVTNWGQMILSEGMKRCGLAGLLLAAICAAGIIASEPGNAQSPQDNQPAPAQAAAEEPSPPKSSPPQSPDLSVELNKLETLEKGCRAYVVVVNKGDTAYRTYKLDLVLFQTDGIIGRRFALDLAPLKPNKRVVKLFDLDGIACDRIGSLLINDVLECKSDSGSADDCLARMSVSSRAPNIQLSK